MASGDYYELLGVSRSADEGAIKKAYRKLAVQWHPDKNPDRREEAEEMFKLIAEAYEVLSNKEKRLAYDRYGKEGVTGGASTGVHSFNDAEEIFKSFFGGADPFESFFRGGFGGGFGGADDPFGSVFGGGGGMKSMFSSSFGGGMGGGFGSSTSISTTVINGVKVTKKTTTTTDANGKQTTVVEESRTGADGRTETTRKQLEGNVNSTLQDGGRMKIGFGGSRF
ncbi:hypothetical protein AB1Y20_006482 [Prymnesium parvum]|uniref:J domain-containing protein n=1 Tax=Prymnesium parvum TaxID=97485 RepID=A0AB34IYV8_PRYPA